MARKRCLFFLFFALCMGSAWAQKKAYVVMLDGDTIYGTIKPSTPAQRSAKIQFVRAEPRQELNFDPTEIAGWSEDGVYYASKVFSQSTSARAPKYAVFMIRHSKADMPLEYYEYYNTDAPGGGYVMHFLVLGERILEVPRAPAFYKALANFLADDEELSAALRQKEYRPKHLRKIVARYNERVSSPQY